uniref:Uncharacterized protein n=1 Tax=Rhizophora mucronata TaxID=61149 RepID=A0A2P2QD74_RHIMU
MQVCTYMSFPLIQNLYKRFLRFISHVIELSSVFVGIGVRDREKTNFPSKHISWSCNKLTGHVESLLFMRKLDVFEW